MKVLKLLVKPLIYFLLITGILFLLYSGEIWDFLEKLSSSNEGVLTGLYNKIAHYFTYADAWNLIFIIIILCVLLLFFLLNDIWVQRLLRKVVLRKPKLKVLLNEWFQITGQKIITAVLLFVECWIVMNLIIVMYSSSKITSDVEKIESKKTALLLGTSKFLIGSLKENKYFTYRIDATVNLYNKEKINKIIISGDRTERIHYNEPEDMKKALIEKGVDSTIIDLDYAGYRTLDSILRLKALFGENDVVIISQRFHLERAPFQAWFYRIKAEGFLAKGSMNFSMVMRELFAKPKVVLDLFFFNMQPKSGQTMYRSTFKVSRDLHVIFLILLSFLVLSSIAQLGLVRVKMIYFNLGLTIVITSILVKIYEDNVVDYSTKIATNVKRAVKAVFQINDGPTVADNLSIEKPRKKLEPGISAPSSIDSSFFNSIDSAKTIEVEEKVIQTHKLEIKTVNVSEKNEPKPAEEIVNSSSPEKLKKRRSNPFNRDKQNEKAPPKQNSRFAHAVLMGNYKVKNNDQVQFRLMEDIVTEKGTVPKNTFFTAVVKLDSSRINFFTNSINVNQQTVIVKMSVIDKDTQPGILYNRGDKDNEIDEKVKIIKKILSRNKSLSLDLPDRLEVVYRISD